MKKALFYVVVMGLLALMAGCFVRVPGSGNDHGDQRDHQNQHNEHGDHRGDQR